MQWSDVRAHYPNQWLLVEALEARSVENQRIVDDLAVLDLFPDSPTALQRYRELHRSNPTRELYVLHTSLEQNEITERHWLGVRAAR